ncbi:hypothetical protein AVEN_256554-1 [Araneus ventricosus]|uniref:Uncharacterized protein n=1 Tax=Araneus ventricosus TaxID=182803 RepID=A0A4Y2KAG1_ARAVE|nr:hypothetical protein AVEN_256554-1 [Araneus ventricosus]
MLKEGKGKVKDRFYGSKDLQNSNLVIECKKNPFPSFMRLVVVTQLQGSIERENYKQCNYSSYSGYFLLVVVQCDDEPLSSSFNLSASLFRVIKDLRDILQVFIEVEQFHGL